MRQLTIPEELALPHLLEIEQLSVMLRDCFYDGYRNLYKGRYEKAIENADQVTVTADGDRYAISLGQLLRAEALRRAGRLLESIEAVNESRRWLMMQVDFIARYNDAMAAYLKGCLHYILHNDGGVRQAFNYAHEALVDIINAWRIERNYSRQDDCRDVQDWMSQLLQLQKNLGPEMTFVLPVYRLLDQRMVHTGLKEIRSFQASIPTEAIAKYLPDGYDPIRNQTVSFISLESHANYVAIKSTVAGDVMDRAKKGNLYVFEVAGLVAEGMEVKPTVQRPFVREKGQIAFRPVADKDLAFRGILCLVIREDSES
jgi:tetratricopeptide (TPR) repeat protein